MISSSYEIRTPPKIIECGAGDLNGIFRTLGKNCLLIGPNEVYEKHKGIFKNALKKMTVIYPGFDGEACESQIKRLSAQASAHRNAFIAAFGGGKAMDAAKSVSAKTGLKLAAIPSSAATCAAFTSHSVIYAEEGNFLYEEKHGIVPDVLALVPEILLQQPERFIAAGCADAAAKYYEHTFSQDSGEDIYFEFSKELLKSCLGIFNEADGLSQKNKMAASRLNIITTGMLSAFGGSSFRASFAHALANGITQLFPAKPSLRRLLHGELVGAGILTGLFLLKRIDELVTLRNFFSGIRLFSEFASVAPLADGDFLKAGGYAFDAEPLFKKRGITAEDIANALKSLKLFQTM